VATCRYHQILVSEAGWEIRGRSRTFGPPYRQCHSLGGAQQPQISPDRIRHRRIQRWVLTARNGPFHWCWHFGSPRHDLHRPIPLWIRKIPRFKDLVRLGQSILSCSSYSSSPCRTQISASGRRKCRPTGKCRRSHLIRYIWHCVRLAMQAMPPWRWRESAVRSPD
jgi:hypothetical protein